MKTMFIKLALAVVISNYVSVAHAGGVSNVASEITQLANNAQLTMQYSNMLQQYDEMIVQTAHQANTLQQQINTYNNLVRNTKKLSNLEWGTASTHLLQLRDLVNDLQSFGYSLGSINDIFEKQYPGFSNISISNRPDHETFSESYQDWNRTTTDTIQSSLSAAGLQESQFDDENATMRTLENMGQTADGQMQALEVGNMIAAQAVRQTQKLRQLTASNMRMQGAYMAQQTQLDAERQQVRESYIIERHDTTVGDEQSAGFPTR